MDVIVGLHASGALLVLIAGLAKVVRPDPTSELLATLGLPDRHSLTVGIGVGEAILGVAALAIGGPLTAGLVGLAYVGFTVVVIRALASGAPSCGCFGRADAPPSWIHVAGNTAFAVMSFVAIAGETPLEVLDRQPAGGLAFVLLVGIIAGLALVAFTSLPEALAARTGSSPAATFRIDPIEEAQP